MFYRLSLEVLGLRSRFKNIQEIEFPFDTPRPTIISLKTKHPNGEEPAEASSIVCVGTTTEEIADQQVLADLTTALSTSVDGVWANFTEIMASGRRPLVWSTVDSVFDPLHAAMRSLVTIFRWREGLMQDAPNPFRQLREYCSLNGETWFQIHAVRGLRIRFLPSVREVTASSEARGQVVELVETGIEEPLGHQLFREAWNQREANPRSALVIGVAAAEVGLKKLIGGLAPHTQWLVDELQAPPLSKMMRKFLPTLPVKLRFVGKRICPPNRLLNKLDKAVACRNDSVHAGKTPPTFEELQEILLAVYDFLCICDMYAGYGWAHSYISAETIGAWEDE
jgi:hypothetical protein